MLIKAGRRPARINALGWDEDSTIDELQTLTRELAGEADSDVGGAVVDPVVGSASGA